MLVNGTADPDLTLTSEYTWCYGTYPFTSNLADSDGHHWYDDVRTMFGRTLPAGASGVLTLALAQGAPGRQGGGRAATGLGDRHQTIAVDGSIFGSISVTTMSRERRRSPSSRPTPASQQRLTPMGRSTVRSPRSAPPAFQSQHPPEMTCTVCLLVTRL